MICPDDEIGEAFALRRQQSCPDRQFASDVAGNEPLEELADVLARKTKHCAVRQGGASHAP